MEAETKELYSLRNDLPSTQTIMVRPNELHTFKGHPFKVEYDTELYELMRSIEENGVLVPLIVRQNPYGSGYEIIAGHRRKAASEWAHEEKIPVMVMNLSDEEATIIMVDTNLQREHLKPSEKAFAYKMKADAMAHQGWRSDLTSGQLVPKSDDNRTTAQIGADIGDSYKTVQRYIRLTNLIPEILKYVDEGRISFTPAVELSYLNEQEQHDLLEQIEQSDCTPSLSQACRFKKISQGEGLTPEVIAEIMEEEKANQREMFKVPMERIRQYIPNANAKQAEDFVLKACEHYRKFLIRQRNRDER